MATGIRHIEWLDASFETGYGVPTHIQLRGSLFIDITEPNLYQNQDGFNTWTPISSGGSGGTSDSFSIFSANTGTVSAGGANQTMVFNGININILTDDINNTITFSAATGGGGVSPSANTFVDTFTYNNANKITLGRNDAVTFEVNLNVFTGITVNGDLVVTGDTIVSDLTGNTITGNQFFGDGSGLSGISTEDNFVSGGTFNTGTTALDFVGTNSATTFSVDVSDLANLPIVDIDKITGNISLIGYGIASACKIQRINTTGGGYSSTWANGDDITLDKVWSLRLSYSYF